MSRSGDTVLGVGGTGVHSAPAASTEESGSGHVGALKADFRGDESAGGSSWTESHRAFGAKQLGGAAWEPVLR